MLVMWTSMMGPSKIFRASTSATDVKQQAAGLMTMASAVR
jgi:hypothetical protein